MRLWSDSIAGRTVALLLGVTVVLIIGGALLLHDERRERFGERHHFQMIDRVVTLVRLLDDVEPAERQRILERVSKHGDAIALSDHPSVNRPPTHPLERLIGHKLRRALHTRERSAIRVGIGFRENGDDEGREDDDREDDDEHHRRHEHRRKHELEGIEISVRLHDGDWLNIRSERFEGPPPWAGKTLQLFALLLLLLVISGLVIARRMARPMAQLADAADRFGMGHTQAPLAEEGPREVRHTIRAFNRMQERLHKHITERSQMLAAVSHDLRTPITTLRLRAEYIQDDEVREKTLATLAEMAHILAATLSFARDEAADEKARATDLAALLQSLVDDHADLGGSICYQGPERLTFLCRPVALRRALNNVIDNALKYGESATVSLSALEGGVEIRVDDNGPGIPEAELEQVFTPFYRLEKSRSRETGGTGLGLAVARTIVLAHGGDIRLANLAQGGLRVRIALPQS